MISVSGEAEGDESDMRYLMTRATEGVKGDSVSAAAQILFQHRRDAFRGVLDMSFQ